MPGLAQWRPIYDPLAQGLLRKQVVDDIRRHLGEKVFDTVIPRNVRLGEAPSFGKTVLAYDIKSRGAEAYLDLGRELLRRNGARK